MTDAICPEDYEMRVRKQIAAELRKRADRHFQRSDERYYVVPSAKADECRFLADQIEEGGPITS